MIEFNFNNNDNYIYHYYCCCYTTTNLPTVQCNFSTGFNCGETVRQAQMCRACVLKKRKSVKKN